MWHLTLMRSGSSLYNSTLGKLKSTLCVEREGSVVANTDVAEFNPLLFTPFHVVKCG